jgi:hypothetical protein
MNNTSGAMAIAIGRQVEVFSAGNEGDIGTAFESLVKTGVDGLVVHARRLLGIESMDFLD